MITALIDKLTALTDADNAPVFRHVGDTLEAAAIKPETRPGVSAYVVQLNEVAGDNDRMTGPVLQQLQESVGIILVLQSRNDRTGTKARVTLDKVRKAVRAELLGKQPTLDHSALLFQSGELLEMTAGFVIWLDTYTTTSHIEG